MRACTAAERLRRGALALAGILAIGCATPTAGEGASQKLLAATPYMGWDTYFTYGNRYNEATILAEASSLITDGLQRDGYRLIWLDVGWWQGQRDAAGSITVNPQEWPHGMAWLTRTLHHEGFKVGLYTDAGINGCGGKHQGSYGHYQRDVNTFARWGFDAVKVDFCGGDQLQLTPVNAYTKFHDAIIHNASHRPMLLDICVFPQPGQVSSGFPSFGHSSFASYSFGPSVGNSWRTDTDVGSPAGITWNAVLRNLDADATEPFAAGPGHWNDPDYLGPDLGLTDAQFQTQFSMWAMLAAPLMISQNLSVLSPASLATVTNKAMIAIDQDRLGRQATQVQPSLVSTTPTDPGGEVWYRPLTGGRYAVALLNTDSVPLTISTSTQALAFTPSSSYTLSNVWAGGAKSSTSGAISAAVAPYSTVVFVVTPH